MTYHAVNAGTAALFVDMTISAGYPLWKAEIVLGAGVGGYAPIVILTSDVKFAKKLAAMCEAFNKSPAISKENATSD